MKLFSKILLASAFCFTAETLAAQTVTIGYTNGNVERKQGVRFGTNNHQGLAIRISKEKAQLLKGAKVVAIEYVHSTTQISNLKFFFSNQLYDNPQYSEAVGTTGTRWRKLTLATPYTITGEEFFVGYTCDVPADSYRPHLFDMSNDLGGEVQWAMANGVWTDVSEKGYGAANLRLIVEGATGFADATIKPVSAKGFFKVGEGYTFGGQLFNFGTEPLKSFDITCQIGESEPAVFNVKNVNVAPMAVYDFNLPEYVTTMAGKANFKMTVSNINGKNDADATDNTATTTIRVYPKETQKKVLLEMFTGQGCGNCPDGHKVLHQETANQNISFIEVAHHAGYMPDAFTMKEDFEYTWLYNGQTFAPAATFNRAPIADGETSVVLQANDARLIKDAVTAVKNTEPYVGIKMDNQFDEATRKGTLTVTVNTYFTPSDDIHRLNVCLTQDSIISYQSGAGSNFVHNAVFRGALNGVWGEDIQLKDGESVVKTYEYTIPEAILSSHEGKVKIPVVLKNMNLVAFVSKAAFSPLTCTVFNTETVKVIDNNITGIEDLTAQHAALHIYGHQVTVNGAAATSIYNAAGVQVASFQGNGTATLATGLYIVKTTDLNGKVDSQKIYIR